MKLWQWLASVLALARARAQLKRRWAPLPLSPLPPRRLRRRAAPPALVATLRLQAARSRCVRPAALLPICAACVAHGAFAFPLTLAPTRTPPQAAERRRLDVNKALALARRAHAAAAAVVAAAAAEGKPPALADLIVDASWRQALAGDLSRDSFRSLEAVRLAA